MKEDNKERYLKDITEEEFQAMSISEIYGIIDNFFLRRENIEMLFSNNEAIISEFYAGLPPEDDDKKNENHIAKFLQKYQRFICKPLLVMISLQNCQTNLKGSSLWFGREDEIKFLQDYVSKYKELLIGWKNVEYRKSINKEGRMEIITYDPVKLRGNHKVKVNDKEKKQNVLLILENVLRSLTMSDLSYLICDNKLGDLILYQTYYNTTVMDKKSEKSKSMIDFNYTFEELFPEFERAVRENIEEIDLDILLLCSAYRYIEHLENNLDISDDYIIEIKKSLDKILPLIDQNAKIQGKIEKTQKNPKEEVLDDVEYSVDQLRADLRKFDGLTYWGKEKAQRTKMDVFLGKIQLRDVDTSRVKFIKEEVFEISLLSNDNYLIAIERNLLDTNLVYEINKHKNIIFRACLAKLLEKNLIIPSDIIEVYLQGKVSLDNMKQLGINFNETINLEDMLTEYKKEDNEERKQRYIDLYRNTIAKDEEKKDENKEKISEKFLETEDAGYLELFIETGMFDFTDLDGIMTSKEWIKAYKKGQISESFLTQLEEKGMVSIEDIKQNESICKWQIKAWDEGKISNEVFNQLGLSKDELFELCDKAEIKGTRIGELVPEEDREKIRRDIESKYVYGIYETIRPVLVAYNLDLISMDKAIELIKAMKVPTKKVKEICEEGLLAGQKIAELRYRGCINKTHFADLKKNGFVSDRDEIDVANNLTPAEMIRALEENGCSKIEDLEEILGKLDSRTGNKGTSKTRPVIDDEYSPTIKHYERIINPIKRYELLELIGTDTIVTTPVNGFKGYQAFLIPKLGVAVLEKLFRENRDGEVKPTYGDATYICEIGKYIQVSGQSKREIREFMELGGSSNGNVERIPHLKNWGNDLLTAITKVNPDISINKEGDVIKTITRQIEGTEEMVNLDITAIQDSINHMRQGDYIISMEVYD